MTRQDISYALGSISTRHIQEAESYFEESRIHRIGVRKIALIAAIFTTFFILTGFAVSIFSAWSGDRLVMNAAYSGNGIVYLEITNQSDKNLTLEPSVKLYYYSTQSLVESTGKEPYVSALTIPANSTKKIRLDLRQSYDVAALEKNDSKDFYYLQVTNDGFLPGQKWSCMISFVVNDYVTPYYEITDGRNLNAVLPSLQSYYYNFTPDIFARWTDSFDYQELVEAELSHVEGNIVAPASPWVIYSRLGWLSFSTNSQFDGYNKVLGRNDAESYYQAGCYVPRINDSGKFVGTWGLPLFYFYIYSVSDIQSPQDYAFVRGNLLTFEEMAPYKVCEDEQYVVYEMHDFVYADLRTYVEEMLLQREDVYFDDQVWKRVENYYHYWGDRKRMESHFVFMPKEETVSYDRMTIEDVTELSSLGRTVTFEDFQNFGGTYYDAYYRHGAGISYLIDDDYEFFYSMNMDWTPNGCYLIHNPSGDMLDICQENADVEVFVEAHGPAEPRCECEDTSVGNHGWHLTLDWLIAKGNTIEWELLDGACHINCSETDIFVCRYVINSEFFVGVCWDDNIHEWVLVLVHAPSGDQCRLKTENVEAFISTHQE
ncbi:MAG: hypothetical protein ACI4EX_08270 [Lachnospiraceae bacterium]